MTLICCRQASLKNSFQITDYLSQFCCTPLNSQNQPELNGLIDKSRLPVHMATFILPQIGTIAARKLEFYEILD
jgi:hypothetical protein